MKNTVRTHFYLLFFFMLHLTACSKNQSCTVVTLEIQPSAIKCIFYPDTQMCSHGLQGHSCWVLIKEPATYIYRRQGKNRLNLWRKALNSGALCTILVNGGLRIYCFMILHLIKQYGCLLDTCPWLFRRSYSQEDGKNVPKYYFKNARSCSVTLWCWSRHKRQSVVYERYFESAE